MNNRKNTTVEFQISTAIELKLDKVIDFVNTYKIISETNKFNEFINLYLVIMIYLYDKDCWDTLIKSANFNSVNFNELSEKYSFISNYSLINATNLINNIIFSSNTIEEDLLLLLLNIVRDKSNSSKEIDTLLKQIIRTQPESLLISGTQIDSYISFNRLVVNPSSNQKFNFEYQIAADVLHNKEITILNDQQFKPSKACNIFIARKYESENSINNNDFFDSDLKYSEVIKSIISLGINGKTYIALRHKTWEHDSTIDFKKFIIDGNYLASVVYIKTDRLNPWLLLELTPGKVNRSILFISEDFYTNGAKKTFISQEDNINKLANIINSRETDNINGCGLVSTKTCIDLEYKLDCNACINYKDSKTSEITITLEDICIEIFRGPHIYINQLQSTSNKYFMPSQSALTDNNFNINNMISIPEETFLENQQFKIYPNDILILSRSTSNKVVLVPEDISVSIINSNIICIRADNTKTQAEYLYLLLNSPYGKTLLENIEKGARVKSVNLKLLKKIKIRVQNYDQQVLIAKNYKQITSELKQAQKRQLDFIENIPF